MSSHDFDICIIGGGLAGASAALALGQQGWRVAMIEANQARENFTAGTSIDSYDLRVSAITPDNACWLTALGAWQQIENRCDYQHMSVWDGEGTADINFDAESIGPRIEQFLYAFTCR